MNVLTNPAFTIERSDGSQQKRSLPGVLEELSHGNVLSFPRARRHQIDPSVMFLAQLGAAVLDECAVQDVAQPEMFWTEGLRRLAGRNDDLAWAVCGDDSDPAFLQAPAADPEQKWRLGSETPDQLDYLQLAKNHDAKRARIPADDVELWLLALITLQTMGGFDGKGNYGVSRMNSGTGSRPCVATVSARSVSSFWRTSVTTLLDVRPDLLPPARPYRRDGVVFAWLEPWDGKTSLAPDVLHPYFIEIARPVRLRANDDALRAETYSTMVPRTLGAKENRGDMGDVWTPIRRKDNAALTVSGAGFSIQLLRDLLIGHRDYEPAPAQRLEATGPVWLHASGLARGQGKTSGLHEAAVFVPEQVRSLLLAPGSDRDRLAELSEWALEVADQLRSKALRPALFSFLEGGPDEWPDTKRATFSAWVGTWLESFGHVWQERYFPWLWSAVDDQDAARTSWKSLLLDTARENLSHGFAVAPLRSARQYRARVLARGLFENRARTVLEE